MDKPKRPPLAATPAMTKAVAKAVQVSAIRKKPNLEIRRSTRVGEVYWCAFSPHNWLPEFDDQHLVVVIRGGKKEHDAHVVVPLTKQPQPENPHGYRLTSNPNPSSAPEAWAVCNHVYTVAPERLKLLRDAKGVTKDPDRLSPVDLAEIARRVFKALKPFFDHGYPPRAVDGA
ncbi:type II toxin-antitoxin system PemK/MazF family toxin [Caulobacter sp. 602-1]|uniref:type II toxin-antitoxin system PemK/MazF family toxin n=1 Tax=Caulobacter sp. 602-1 TaxID=2492472 RepID=UPI000F62D63E|nr:type II toxin-antitoxin system PemK/MazF family toxin [Caulobacter sp. 602-1]RRN65071.1 hypothetical protein EIK80_05735 [Caulobacter sp. 602-1]